MTLIAMGVTNCCGLGTSNGYHIQERDLVMAGGAIVLDIVTVVATSIFAILGFSGALHMPLGLTCTFTVISAVILLTYLFFAGVIAFHANGIDRSPFNH